MSPLLIAKFLNFPYLTIHSGLTIVLALITFFTSIGSVFGGGIFDFIPLIGLPIFLG
jgi:hypothetical protein